VYRLQRTTTLHECAAVPRRARSKAHRLLDHPTLGLRVMMKEKKKKKVQIQEVQGFGLMD
jgi:hypothetical protein